MATATLIAAASYIIRQDYAAYTPEQHSVWSELVGRVLPELEKHAAREYLEGFEIIGLQRDRLPNLAEITRRLGPRTGWSSTPVSGFLPAPAFFEMLANRLFPTTTWLRSRESLEYTPEPDIFHDVFGHVPMHAHKVFGDFLEHYGRVCAAISDQEITGKAWPPVLVYSGVRPHPPGRRDQGVRQRPHQFARRVPQCGPGRMPGPRLLPGRSSEHAASRWTSSRKSCSPSTVSTKCTRPCMKQSSESTTVLSEYGVGLGRAFLSVRLWQRVRHGSRSRRAPARAERPAEASARPLHRAVQRLALHRAARHQSPHLDLPHPAIGHASPVRRDPGEAHSQRPVQRSSHHSQSAPLGSDPHPHRVHGLRRRHRYPRRQRRSRHADRPRHPSLRLQRLDARPLLLHRRRRAPHRAAGRRASFPHRARHPPRRSRRNLRPPARPQVPC